MQLIKTPSFELAIISQGNSQADKLALVLPGRLDTKDYAQNPSHLKMLAARGYHAVSFDPPGTWDSPGGIELYTTTNYIKAVNELIELFGNRPTLLMGHSRGGMVAMLVGAQNPHVTHMISVNSSSGGKTDVDVPEPGHARISLRDLPPGTTRTEQKQHFDLPYAYFTDGDQYSTAGLLAACAKPKLFFYGEQDEIVPPAVVQLLYAGSADPKMLHGLDVEHDYRLHPEVIGEVNAVVERFLDDYPAW